MPLTSHNSSKNDNDSSQPAFGLPIAAPVLEYICLFTHDLKRKQKRWQDGRLKFHTFNKRIMVYDERGNFIGDVHWREDFDFGEGEEFNLERGAVIVQVAECVGSKDQDLTELLDKRAREVEQRYARSSAAAANSPRPTVRPSVMSQNHPQAQFRQRHLTDVFNTPRGPQGRAVIPTTSPYEERIAAQQSSSPQDENQRPAKRRKRDVSPPSKSGYAQNLFGATLSLSSWSASAPVRHQPGLTPRNASPIPETAPNSVVPSRIANPSWPRPFAAVDLTDDGSGPENNHKPLIAIERGECISNPTEAPPKKTTLAPNPFKAPGVNASRSKATQREGEIPTETEETPEVSGQQPGVCIDNPRSISAKRSTRKSQDTKRESIPRQPGAQPSNGILHESAYHRIFATRELPEPRSVVIKDVGSSVSQPATEEPLVRVAVDMGPEEPKTKLRIKASKKRGLLMVTKASTRVSTRRTDSPETEIEAPSAEQQLRTGDTSPNVGQTARSVSPVDMLSRSVNSGLKRDTSCCKSTRVHNDNEIKSRSNPVVEATAQPKPEPIDSEDSQPSDEPVQSRVKLQERKRKPSCEPHREVEAMSTQPGPRLASLGRRSVKSKEIIGSFNQRQYGAAAPRKEPFMSPNNGSEDNSSIKNPDSVKEAETRPERATCLTNPATRGCKAAKKSDAAGSVPQPVLTAIPDLAVGRIDERGGSRQEAKSDSRNVEVMDESAQRLFGFSRASGGPWSKEAYDLLGCTRPG
ncbi:hypothetical protein CI238_03254 [Colletotrichum incanum]|uniref:5'-3' DNA helicase ZGRF1-like N-terminal domain-containing protein n=1 Tax=Colletotrichum incanum TaxID=1573173 RepID=A0A162P6S7_COLIC|nr:hypothetical protein CI238_03254 [Colletotrichum incanum]